MKVLALDVSTKTGWAVWEGEVCGDSKLISYGVLKLPRKVSEYGSYPFGFVLAADEMVYRLEEDVIKKVAPDVIVVEETNLGKNRYSQKILEFIHCHLVSWAQDRIRDGERDGDYRSYSKLRGIAYISSSEWRKNLGLVMSKDDKINNKVLKKAKELAAATKSKLDKSKVGIKGAVTKKHLAIRFVNATYGLDLKVKDNDIADAICLGAAYLNGARTCDGT